MEYAPAPTSEQLAALGAELEAAEEPRHVRRLTGGLGCTMDVVELVGRDGAVRRLVLRRYGPWYGERSIAHDEFQALRTARAGDVPAPEPIWLDATGIFTEPAVAISFLDGAPDLDPADGDGAADLLAQVAARIHGAPVDADAKRALPDLREAVAREIAESVAPARFAEHPMGVDVWNRLRVLLEATAFGDASFAHGDFWPGNVMWRDARLVAVVDWEDAGFNDPAADVAYCATDLRYLRRDEIADRFIEGYRERSGRRLESLPFWTLYSLSRALPDIDRWLPSWQAMGRPELTAVEIRSRHARLIEQALDETG